MGKVTFRADGPMTGMAPRTLHVSLTETCLIHELRISNHFERLD
jgi:hypothetical protein